MSLTTSKRAKFRVRIEDLETKKHKVFTVYKNGKERTLKDFEAELKEKITAIEVPFDFDTKEAVVECAYCGNIERAKGIDVFTDGLELYPCPRCKGMNELRPSVYASKPKHPYEKKAK